VQTLETAVSYFNQAIAKDPGYATAYAVTRKGAKAVHITKIRVDKCHPCLSVTRRTGISPSPSSGNNVLFVRGCRSVRLPGTGLSGLSCRW
jgi:hypothetical protein